MPHFTVSCGIRPVNIKNEVTMTPSKAIKIECKTCLNSSKEIYCIEACNLNDLSLSPIKRIRAHCISCVSEQNIKAVRACSGVLGNGKACPLYPYREGHNPKRKGIGNRNATFKTRTHDAFSRSNFNQSEAGHIKA